MSTLKQEIGIPIQLHTHDTTGNQVAALLLAAEAGVDVVDCAISSMAGMTSQPSLNAVVAAMKDTERDTGLDLDRLQTLTDYWEDVRKRYDSFEGGLEYNTTDIYRYEIPGGQYTNLKPQVESLGLGDRFVEVKENYRKVNEMVGDIVKVTPSSKMVGDLAIFMTQNNLTPENIVEKGESLAFPDSVVSYFSGMMGQPAGGFPKELERVVLKGKKPITCRPGELLPPVDFEEKKREMQSFDADPSWRAILSYCLYPKVVEDYVKNQKEYGYIMRLGSHVFFHGLAVGETNKVNIADGKTLVIKYLGLGEVDKEGMRTVSFELNGIRRDVQVPDEGGPEEHCQGPHGGPGGQEPGGLLYPRRGEQAQRQGGRHRGEEPDPGHHRGYEDGDRHHRPDVRHGVGDPGEGGRDRQGRPAHLGHQISIRGRRPALVGPAFGISERWDGKMKVVQIGLAEILKIVKKPCKMNEDKV